MNILIKYSSGTGNTAYIADILASTLKESGDAVECSAIEVASDFRSFDLLVVGGPIYAGNCPEKLIRYVIRNVPAAQHKKAVVFSTSTGLLNAHGVSSLSSKLHKKGYDVLVNERFVMPRNYYFGHYQPMESGYCRELFVAAASQARTLAGKIHAGVDEKPEIAQKGIVSKDLLAELFSVMAKFMGRSFKANQNCTLCMKCVRNCPQNNIKKSKDGIVFGFDCMMCTRCIHGCPAHAIEYSKKTYRQYRIQDYTTP